MRSIYNLVFLEPLTDFLTSNSPTYYIYYYHVCLCLPIHVCVYMCICMYANACTCVYPLIDNTSITIFFVCIVRSNYIYTLCRVYRRRKIINTSSLRERARVKEWKKNERIRFMNSILFPLFICFCNSFKCSSWKYNEPCLLTLIRKRSTEHA